MLADLLGISLFAQADSQLKASDQSGKRIEDPQVYSLVKGLVLRLTLLISCLLYPEVLGEVSLLALTLLIQID